MPGRSPGGVAYGAILVGALLAAESGHNETYPEAIASGFTVAGVFWLTHAYTAALDRRVALQERITARALGRALAHDLAVLRGAAIPLLALLLAWASGASLETGVTVALWSSALAIFIFELAAGVGAGARGRELALDAIVGAVLGVAVLVLHAILV